MKAIVLDGFGAPDVMRVAEVEAPVAAAGQVLIDVHATSVNRPDIVQREGNYPPPKGDSDVLGLEVAGVVHAVGDGVTSVAPGDRVMALVGGGGYAEQALAFAGHVMPIPGDLSFEQAACIPETYITAWLNVLHIGRLAENERVLLHGGGGGVNTAAIQLVGALRPDVTRFVTASPAKRAGVEALGVEHVIDYKNKSFSAVIKTQTEGRGVDVILDHIGADYLADNMKCLAVGGRLVVIGVMSGIKAELNLALMMVKRQTLIGSVLRSRPADEKTSIISEFAAAVLPGFAAGDLVPAVDRVMTLDEAADAHRIMEASQHFGKIVLQVQR